MAVAAAKTVGICKVNVLHHFPVSDKSFTYMGIFYIHMEYIGHKCEVFSSHLSDKFCTLVNTVDVVDFIPVHRLKDYSHPPLFRIIGYLPHEIQKQSFGFFLRPITDASPDSSYIHKASKLTGQVYKASKTLPEFSPSFLVTICKHKTTGCKHLACRYCRYFKTIFLKYGPQFIMGDLVTFLQSQFHAVISKSMDYFCTLFYAPEYSKS